MKPSRLLILFLICYFMILTASQSAIVGLTAQIRPVPGLSRDSTPAAYAQKVELIDKVSEVLETVLYAKEGKEKAYEEGRRIFKDYNSGTITVVDTKENQLKVSDYFDQLSEVVRDNAGSTYTKPRSKIVNIRHADPNNLRNILNQIIQESRMGSTGSSARGQMGDYVTGIITPGAGNGLIFLTATVELVNIIGQDTATAQAQLYIYTPQRDQEVTLSKGNSTLVDAYRIRLLSVDPKRQEAGVEIRLASPINLP